MRRYVLYNPLAGDEQGEKKARRLESLYTGQELIYRDLTAVEDYGEFFASLDCGDDVIICGGDGTLSRFVNAIDGIEIKNDILYYAIGSGNDFLHDLGKPNDNAPFRINHYIENLPCVYIDGKKRKFINGVGYGLDGYVCEAGNIKRRKSKKKINYTTIALKALLFAFKPRNAAVIIDGEEKHYRRVWLTPAMKGKFFGGGMMIAPHQDRTRGDLTVVIAHGCSRLRLLTIFPTIFKGAHVKYKKFVEVFSAKEVTIVYDKPCAMQIDGETVTDVKMYTAKTHASEPAAIG